jgi:hypothetical protein
MFFQFFPSCRVEVGERLDPVGEDAFNSFPVAANRDAGSVGRRSPPPALQLSILSQLPQTDAPGDRRAPLLLSILSQLPPIAA